jgi:hypothetical protein
LSSSELRDLPTVQSLLNEPSICISSKKIEEAIKNDLPISEAEYRFMRENRGSALFSTVAKAREVRKLNIFFLLSYFITLWFQEKYGDFMDGVSRLPALKDYLNLNEMKMSLDIFTACSGGPYSASALIFSASITAISSIKGAPKFFCTDFCHQYVAKGGYGNLWGLVSCDPDGIFFKNMIS